MSILGIFSLAAFAATAQPVSPLAPEPLVWNTLTNEYTANPGDIIAHLSFYATNISPNVVVIDGAKTSCGCTAAKLPSVPWRLGPNESGRMDVTVDLRGKFGTLLKSVTIDSTNAPKMLLIRITIPPGGTNSLSPEMANRMWNQEMAKADRQAVFKKDCVSCHLQPAFGKSGEPLYQAVCAICHDSPHRATMVPDLKTIKGPANEEFWRTWVTHGKDGTLMPGFAAAEGGPLNQTQIESLVGFLMKKYPPPKDAEPPEDD